MKTSADWINAVDCGGLIHINNMTFELFLSMERNIRGCVKAGQELGDIRYRLKDNEEVMFYWSILTAERTDDVATTILEMIVDLWITVRGVFIGWCMGGRTQDNSKENHTEVKSLRKQLK